MTFRVVVIMFVVVVVHGEGPPVYRRPSYPSPRYQDDYDDAPSRYIFNYKVADDYSGANFGQNEARDGHKTEGSYTVDLPDGRRQTVTYLDVGDGLEAVVNYEGEAQYPEYKPEYKAFPTYKPLPKYKPVPAYKPTPEYKPASPYKSEPLYKPATIYQPYKPPLVTEPSFAYKPSLSYEPSIYEPSIYKPYIYEQSPTYEESSIYEPSPTYEPALTYEQAPTYEAASTRKLAPAYKRISKNKQ